MATAFQCDRCGQLVAGMWRPSYSNYEPWGDLYCLKYSACFSATNWQTAAGQKLEEPQLCLPCLIVLAEQLVKAMKEERRG